MKPQVSIDFDFISTIEAVTRSLANSDDVRTNVRSAMESLSRGTAADFAFFATPDEGDGSLRLAETYGLNLSDFRRLETSLNDDSFRNVFETNVTERIVSASFGISMAESRIICVPATAGKRPF